jgi:hypothetical protein
MTLLTNKLDIAFLESRLTEQAIASLPSESLGAIQGAAEDLLLHSENNGEAQQQQQPLQESDVGTPGARIPPWMKAELCVPVFDNYINQHRLMLILQKSNLF